MSFKTLRKRIALVAVAALAVTGLSTVPASAATAQAAIYVDKNSSVDYAASNITYDMVSNGTTIDTFDGANNGTAEAHGLTATDIGKAIYSVDYGYIGTIASITDTNTFTLAAAPTQALLETGTGDELKLFIGTPAATFTANPILNANQISGLTATAGKRVGLAIESIAANGTAANADAAGQVRVAIDGVGVVSAEIDNATLPAFMVPFTAPAVAGTYAMTITYSSDGAFDGVVANEIKIGFTLTVVADSAFSAGVSTVYMNDDSTANDAATTAATDALGATGIKTNGSNAAVIWVNTKKANGTVYSGGTLYAFMTGAGFLDIDGDTPVRSESAANDGNHYIMVNGDGTSGEGTINIYMILADGVTKVDLPSKKVKFYGDVAKLEATVVQGIARVGAANGDCGGLTDCTYATLAEKPAVLIKATDSAGVLVPDLTVTASFGDATIVSASSISGATGGTDYNGAGYYNASVTGGTAAQVGKSTTVTYKVTLSSGTVISSNAVNIALAGSPSTVTFSFDKAAYAPGEKGTITVNVKDSAGNNAADGTYATLLAGASTTSLSVQGSTPAASVEVVGGKATYTFYAPVQTGTFSVSNKIGATIAAKAGTDVTASATVSGGVVETQIAALVAAIAKLQKAINKIQKRLNR